MDIVALQKKAIFVPTPGQTEQEYLAAYLREQNLAYTIAQNNFSLPSILIEVKDFKYNVHASTGEGKLKSAIQKFTSKLQHAD